MLADNHYSYDSFNRLAVAEAENARQVNRYDAEGLRHELEENGELVKFIFSGKEVVVEQESDGNVIRYIRGLGLISSDSEKARNYYHYAGDEMGSITHVVMQNESEAPQVLNHYEYDAFGNTVVCEETVHNRFRYTGQQYDAVTSQYYLRSRFYNPVIGRFLQEDTYLGDGLNLLSYCQNNPLMYYDPSGNAVAAICPKKYNEWKAKDPSELTDMQRAQMKRYERGKNNPYYQAEAAGFTSREAYNILNADKTAFATAKEFEDYYYGKLLKAAGAMEKTPENAKLIGSQKTWEEFLAHNPSSDLNKSAESYIDLIIGQSAWPEDYDSAGNVLPLKEGDTFYMVLDKKQDKEFPGSWGIIDEVPNTAFVRNDMAVKSNWKADCEQLVQYRVKSGIELNAEAGPIGPQIDLWADAYLPGNMDVIQLDIFKGFPRNTNKMEYIEYVENSTVWLK